MKATAELIHLDLPPDSAPNTTTSAALDPTDIELLSRFLRRGRATKRERELACSLLRAGPGLVGLSRLSTGELTQLGLGAPSAGRLRVGLELGRRSLEQELSRSPPLIDSLEAVLSWASPRLVVLEHEEVWLLSLDGKNGLKATHRVGKGGAHGCSLLPRDILRPAVRDLASAVILVHNHPSGDCRPSPDDVSMTQALAEACDLVGIPLLDHVVVARSGASSLLELGLLHSEASGG